MNRAVRRKNVLISLAGCLVAFFAAVCLLLFPSKVNKVEASADASLALFWEDGAEFDMYSASAQRIKYTLHIDSTYNKSSYFLYVQVGTGLGSSRGLQKLIAVENPRLISDIEGKGLYLDENGREVWIDFENEEGRNSYFEIDCWSVFDRRGYEFLGQVSFAFEVYDIYEDFTLAAGIYYGNNLSAIEVSDSCNLHEIWSEMYEGEDPALENNPYVSEYMEFENTIHATDFAISPAVQLSSSTGMHVQLNIPKEWRQKLYNPYQKEVDVSYSSGFGAGTVQKTQYTNYFLVVVAADSDAQFSQQFDLASGVKKTWFKGATLGDEYTIQSALPLPDGFRDNSCGTVSLNVSEGYSHYYAYIVCVMSIPVYDWDGIGSSWWHSGYTYELQTRVEATTRTQQYFSTKDIARNMLENNLTMTSDDRQWLMLAAGVNGYGEYVRVKLTYKKMNQDGENYGEVVSVSDEVGSVPMEIAFAKKLVLSELSEVYDINHPSAYNIVFNGRYYQDGYVYNTEERIVLQARDYKYTFHEGESAASSYCELEVVYEDFQYKDLNLRITNNDADDHLTMGWYTTNVSVDEGKKETTLIYKFDDIQQQLGNSCKWSFFLKAENISYNEVDGVAVTVNDEEVKVVYEHAKVNNLLYLQLKATAMIFEDYYIDVTYKYKQYVYEDFSLKIRERESQSFEILASEWNRKINFENFMIDYGGTINEALECSYLEGTYYTPCGIVKNLLTEYGSSTDDRRDTAEIIVQYETNPIFKITNNLSEDVRYKSLTLQDSKEFKGSYFVNARDIEKGYRVNSISSTSQLMEVTRNEDYKKTTLVYRGKLTGNNIIPVLITYTDMWNVEIDYMKQIEGTPFAELVTHETQVKVSDYADIYALTKDDVLKLLPISSFEITGSVTVADLEVAFDGVSTYTIDLEYSHASLKQINYEGEMLELKIPLTSYADWCDSFGKDWSILMLNTEKKQFFRYSSDVARDNLYGLFSVAIFDEQVSDLNYWFKDVTGDGQMTIFSEKQVQGSSVYKFFDNLRSKGVVASAYGHIGMAFCEIVNDNNKMQYMHYFYLDGTKPNGGFISNGGADNADDTDDALNNKGEDIKDVIQNATDKAKDSPWMIVLTVVLGILAVVAVFGASYWMLRKFGVIRRRRSGKKKPHRSLPKKTAIKGANNDTKAKK